MRLIGLIVAFAVLSALFGLVERRPSATPRRWRDRSVRTDVAFWFFTPLVAGTLTRIALAAALVAVAAAVGRDIDPRNLESLLAAHGPLATQPRWLQAVEVLMLADGLGYWMHRLFHGRTLWPFHAVHHGSEQLDWLSSVRLHPVNEVLMRIAQVLPLVMLGFDPRVLAASVPVFTIYALLLHANVHWRLGPLRFVIATPAFHRWHHAADEGRSTRTSRVCFRCGMCCSARFICRLMHPSGLASLTQGSRTVCGPSCGSLSGPPPWTARPSLSVEIWPESRDSSTVGGATAIRGDRR